MSVDTYIRKTKLNNSDYNNIANLPYKDQIEIFRTRSLNKYKQLNRMQSNKKNLNKLMRPEGKNRIWKN